VLVIAVFLILVNCVPIVKAPPLVLDNNSFELSQNHQIGQTFRAEFNGINGIEVYLLPKESGNGIIIAHLLNDPIQKRELAKSSIDISSVLSEQYYLFQFPSSLELERDNYFVALEIEGDGAVFVASRDKDAYLDGSIYLDGEPLEGQMAFELTYDKINLLIGLIEEFTAWVYQFFLSLLIFLIPGWMITRMLWHDSKRLSIFERIAISIGVSIAIYPMIILWTDFVGIHLGQWYAWIPLFIGVTYLTWSYLISPNRKVKLSTVSNKLFTKLLSSQNFWENLSLFFLLIIIFFIRFWVIRGLSGPMWGDSLQHTMMARLLVDNNGLFDSWLPYAELSTFTYHFGFHSAVAIYHWISGQEIMESVLWVGQLFNGFAVFMLYPLVKSFSKKSRWGGIIAVLIAGLLLRYPMYYVNWGRYTQLTGQIILPILMLLFIQLLKKKELDFKYMILSAILIAGLALTHYRVFILAGIFCFLALIFYFKKENGKNVFKNLTGTLILSLILFLPWLINVVGGVLANMFKSSINSPAQSGISVITYINELLGYYPTWVWLFVLVSLFFSLYYLEKEFILIQLWSILIVLSTNPYWIGLPGNGLIDDLTPQIGFYIPLSILIGLLIDNILDKISNKKLDYKPILTGLIIFIGLFGLIAQRNIVDLSSHAYLTWPDMEAFNWIKENTPDNSKFLVNFEFSYNNTAVTGIDAGWWIPQLANRKTNLPPLTFTTEKGYEANFKEKTLKLSEGLLNKVKNISENTSFLVDSGYDYIYIGQNPLKEVVFNPKDLSQSGCCSLIYHKDHVWIFKIEN